ncbi:MAG: hypothetical protein IJZ00_03160 [Lachnospiraceae bacterium]|nr:hypothetical protein [Lachnospiraceae bacterium]
MDLTPEMQKLNRDRKISVILSWILSFFGMAAFFYVMHTSYGWFDDGWIEEYAPTAFEFVLAISIVIWLSVFSLGGFIMGFIHTESTRKSFKKSFEILLYIPIIGWYFYFVIYMILLLMLPFLCGWIFLFIDTFKLICRKPLVSAKENEISKHAYFQNQFQGNTPQMQPQMRPQPMTPNEIISAQNMEIERLRQENERLRKN